MTLMNMLTMMMTFSVVKSDGTSDVGKCSQIDRTSIRVSRGRMAVQCCTEFFFICMFALVFLFLFLFIFVSQIDRTSIRVSRGCKAVQCCAEFFIC